MSHSEITETFTALSRPITCITTTILEDIERFVIKMYDRICQAPDINDARRIIFTKKKCALENIPPTKDALLLHTQRETFQAEYIWG